MDDSTLIKLQGVSIWQDRNPVLEDVHIEVPRSQFVYLIGKVGSGKSSLIKTLYGDLPLGGGRAVVAGFDLQRLTPAERPFLRRRLGVIFQDFQLLGDRTVFDNLDFVLRATGWKSNREKRIDEVLDKVGMLHKREVMPHKLSGGEFQRISIARALLNNPDLILADEPTGNLDPETTQGIVALLHHLASAGRTVVMATHEHSLIGQFPGRVLQCANGRVDETTPSGAR